MDEQKKKGLKIYILIVALAVVMGLISLYLPRFSVFWGNSPDTEDESWKAETMDYVAVEKASWTGLAEEDYPTGEKELLFHNNGQFMECNLIASEGDCRLVGVYCFEFWGQMPVENYYFSNKPFADEASLLTWILTEQYSHSTQLIGRGLDFQAKYFSFAFLDEEGGVQSSMTTRVLAEKKWEDVPINGILGTFWNVMLDSDIETEEVRGIPKFSTLLDVNDENQELMHWEPFNSTTPRVTISFSTSEGLSRTEHYDELPVTVDSSMSENYGKWIYDIPKFPQRKLSMLPQVEVTNQDEMLTMELQHTAVINTGIFRKEELDTGRIRIEFSE